MYCAKRCFFFELTAFYRKNETKKYQRKGVVSRSFHPLLISCCGTRNGADKLCLSLSATSLIKDMQDLNASRQFYGCQEGL